MKLRIEEGKITFRLAFEELERLLDEGSIMAQSPLPTDMLTYQLVCLPSGKTPLFEVQNYSFVLSLARDVIEEHKAALPSMTGIISTFPVCHDGTIDVALEVNLKKKVKRALT